MNNQSQPEIVTFETVNLTQSGNKVAVTIDGKKFYINTKKDKIVQVPMQIPCKVLYSVQEIPGRKPLHWLNWVGSVDQADIHTPKPIPHPQVPKTAQNSGYFESKHQNDSKYSETDLKAFKAKDDAIKRMSALNNASNMVVACSNSLNHEKHLLNMTLQEVVTYWETMEKKFYNMHLKMLNDLTGHELTGDKSSQSGIEVAEEVTSPEYNSGEMMD